MTPEYVLGHGESERERLKAQGGLLAEFTTGVLRQAGIQPGMRVLDVGCGMGDVSLLSADIVGSMGEVVGIDKNGDVLKEAERRAAAAGISHIRFVQQGIDELDLPVGFDAVVGRFVLMHQPDPAGTVSGCTRFVRPGGAVIFIESDSVAGGRSAPAAPLYQQCQSWIRNALTRAGVHADIGMQLARCFEAAGLPVPCMKYVAGVGSGPDFFGLQFYAETIRSLLPAIEQTGAGSRSEIDIDTLHQRLRNEAAALGSQYVTAPVISAWATAT